MRDQHFQELMSKYDNDQNLPSDGPNNVSETQSAFSVGEAKSSCSSEELENQLAFKDFLRRNLSQRKPSSQFIQSIKNRIKIIDSATADN